MLQKDPASMTDPTIANNQVQVRFKNGTVLPLSYEKIDGDDTIWSGTYRYPKATGKNSELIGTVEASAYETTTATQTHFSKFPSKFNNTGISMDFTVSIATPGAYTIKNTDGKILTQFTPVSSKKVQKNWLASFGEWMENLFH